MNEVITKPLGLSIITSFLWGIYGICAASWAWQMALMLFGAAIILGIISMKAYRFDQLFALLIDSCILAAFAYGFYQIYAAGFNFDGWKFLVFCLWGVITVFFGLMMVGYVLSDISALFISRREESKGDRRRAELARQIMEMRRQEKEEGKSRFIIEIER